MILIQNRICLNDIFAGIIRVHMRTFITGFIAFSMVLLACNNSDTDAGTENGDIPVNPAPPVIPYSIVGSAPHDTLYFTEGLEYHNGVLYESSGPGGSEDYSQSPYPSAFGIADPKTGKVSNKVQYDKGVVFGEGITVFRDKVYQLTYKNKIGYVYDARTYKKLRDFPLPSAEGWGLTHDTSSLIMSAGTSKLFFLHPDSLTVRNIITVTDNMGEVEKINELEYINGFIYANQWLTNNVLKIDPATGKVVGKLDFTKLANEATQKFGGANEMNGIAYDSVSGTMMITGKNWPLIYKIKL
jgi:glutamine cyclotransferase